MGRIVTFSGAGLSAESGLNTFRDKGGIWTKYDANEVCNINKWKKNFELVHEFYNKRRVQLGTVNPNAMHKYFKDLEDRYDTLHITQNVDDLLHRAGCKNVLQIHGQIDKVYCTECGEVYRLGHEEYTFWPCKKCGSKWIKPYVIFFGESAPKYKNLWQEIASLKKDDIVLVVGTSGAVIDIASMTARKPSLKILNNLEEDKYMDDSVFDYVFYGKATTKIDEIDRLIRDKMGH
ncbi:Sir2 family NAD-dependent protein deacetylase [Helicobacter sp. 11S02629-2]|uniref:SIR2 family NAD-dependent protein deacylase n=1 Tax=Helicobacter sp. 11S02629-2 TaxID=1476195 RepID=UPI000BA51D42|nr:Sir2 family NAD-dependent protein deacetylase [Helicobacter sp. 11S02629-2]PAF44339.1 hypothetical protein BKH40_05440 [Helicobacter sp. 11S02629-2]